MKMLSVGTLGAKAQRRPVPTRWSITASDDIIGKRMIGELGTYQRQTARLSMGAISETTISYYAFLGRGAMSSSKLW